MIRRVVSNGNVAYNLAAGKAVPDISAPAKVKSKVKRQKDWTQRLELIQDLDFPLSSSRVRVSLDGQFIAATGAYPPLLKIFDTSHLSMKHYRGLDAQAVDMHFLSPDYRKIVLLHDDRTLEFHAQGGKHCRIRVPKPGRALSYLPPSCQLLIAGSCAELYRLDLCEGRHLPPVPLEASAADCVTRSPSMPIVAVGTDCGQLEIFDWRVWGRAVATVNVDNKNAAITAIDFSPDGFLLGCGTSDGLAKVFDVRRAGAVAYRDHRSASAIVGLHVVRSPVLGSTVVSADRSSVKVWTLNSQSSEDVALDPFGLLGETPTAGAAAGGAVVGELVVSLESTAPEGLPAKVQLATVPGCINGLAVADGLILTAQDNPRLGVYFVPALGPAPRWCRFLDALTTEEEREDEAASQDVGDLQQKGSVYDGYKFVTEEELKAADAMELAGTKMVKPSMHGYWIDAMLWRKLRLAAGLAAEDAAQKKAKEELESTRMRIKMPRVAAKVNDELARRLEAEAKDSSGKVAAAAKEVLTDDRFKELFSNPGFAIDVSQVQLP